MSAFDEVDVSELLLCAVDHDKAGVEFFDGPGRGEATRRGGHQKGATQSVALVNVDMIIARRHHLLALLLLFA